MKKTTKYVLAIITGGTLIIGLTACGWHSTNPEAKAEYLVEKVTKKLDLSDAQVVELEKLKTELLIVREEFVGKKDSTHSTLEEILSQPTLDQRRVVDLVREHTDAINEKAPKVVSSMAGFYDSLSLEQQATLREKIAKHREHSHHWHD